MKCEFLCKEETFQAFSCQRQLDKSQDSRALVAESITHHPSIPTCRGPFLAVAGDSPQWREANAQFRRVRLIGCVTTLLSLVIQRCTTIGACEEVC